MTNVNENLVAVSQDPFDLLESRNPSDRKCEYWDKNAEPSVIGKILEKNNFVHDKFGVQHTILLEKKTGDKVSVILNSYLKNGLEFQNAAIGDFIRIYYHGKSQSPSGSTFNKFELDVVKAGSSTNPHL